MWQELAAILNELNKIYQQLIETGRRKRDILVAIDMKALEGLLEEEKQLTQKISLLEQKRQKSLIHLAVENRSIKQDTQMAEVLELAPKGLQPVLRQLIQALTVSTTEVCELRDNNNILIRAAMNAASYHLNRIGGARVESGYGHSGSEVVSHRKNFEFKA